MADARMSAPGPSKGKRGAATESAAKRKASKRQTEKRVRFQAAAALPDAFVEPGRKATRTLVFRGKAAPLSYIGIFRASPLERIEMIRRGIPASEVKRIFADLAIGQGAGVKALSLSVATLNKKAKNGETLSPEESERVVGFAKLVGQLEAMIQASGEPAGFDAKAWMARWLTEPLPAFGGGRPADLLDTMEGQGLVSDALGRVQSGAYA